MAHLLDGKKTAEEIRAELTQSIVLNQAKIGRPPCLVAVLVGENIASLTYVRNKISACAQTGIVSEMRRFPESVSEAELLKTLREINENPSIDGVIVQLPLPAHISEQKVIQTILPTKDVDGFHPENNGKMFKGMPSLLPATPAGIVELLKRNHILTTGKHCVIVGRSQIVGLPLSILMSRATEPGNCTVTLCHSKTPDIATFTKQADILIVAVGKAKMIGASHVKEDAVVIDVGIHSIPAPEHPKGFKLCGDVDFEAVKEKCSWITPVPGGVGPLTIAMLLSNTVQTWQTTHYL